MTQDFANRIRKARLNKELTQAQVAELSGMDLRNYQRIEGAIVSCKIITAEKICHVLDLQKAKALA